MSSPLRIAVSGKGGVGKTTISAGLCLALAERGYEVLALDCDPDSNLASALGFPEELLATIRPISSLTELIEERTGAKPGGYGGMFKLNPHVADIPDTHCYRHGGIRLLAIDTVERGGSGCACPQNVLVKRVVDEVLVRRNEAAVLDMEAGLEHLGRGTAKAVSCMLTVVEPGRRSVATAQNVLKLAADIELTRCFVIGNRFGPDDGFSEFLQPHFDPERILGCIPFDEGIVRADRTGSGIQDMAPATRQAFSVLLDRIEAVGVEEPAEQRP